MEKLVSTAKHINVCSKCGCNPCICNRPETQTFEGGSKRDKELIPCYHLYPREALRRTLERYSHGRIKYGDRNWECGLPAEDCYNRAIEHLSKYVNGFTDEDHLAAAVFNINCIMTYEEEGQVPIDFRRPFKNEALTATPTDLGL